MERVTGMGDEEMRMFLVDISDLFLVCLLLGSDGLNLRLGLAFHDNYKLVLQLFLYFGFHLNISWYGPCISRAYFGCNTVIDKLK
jgi:hypothetical protein